MPQRSDLSRKALKEAFGQLLLQKPLEAISVRDLVQKAQVARSTFYRNFEDKNDFLDWLQADLIQETAEKFAGVIDQEPDFLPFYQYAQANRSLMRAFLTQQHWPALEASLQAHALKHYAQVLDRLPQKIPSDILAAFLVGGHVALFSKWLNSEHPLSIQQMAAYHKRLGQDGVLKTFR